MGPSSVLVLRPVWFFVLLAIVLLVLLISVIPFWHGIISRIDNQVESNSASFTSVLISKVEDTAKLFPPLNSTAMGMARILNFSLNTGTKLSFPDINSKVVPLMFHILSVVPMMSEISYIGSDGLIFSYYFDGNRLVSLYANTSIGSHLSPYNWYKQLADPNTGSLYGSAVLTQPMFHTYNSSWFNEAFYSPSGHHASFRMGWNHVDDLALVNAARVGDIGLISTGFPVKLLNKIFSSIDLNGGSLYLTGRDGRVLLLGLPNTHLSLTSNRSVALSLMSTQGKVKQLVNVLCNSCAGDGESRAPRITHHGTKYTLYCSSLEILGTQVVYVLAIREKFLESFIHRRSEHVLISLVVLTVLLLVVIFSFICIIIGAARREMHRSARLIEQMEVAQQAESKSKNKSLAFVNASHDIRASLACISALIDMCYLEAAPMPELKKNLQQMDSCAKDLLGLLNSILDASKIEAGKMLIDEEEFNLMQLLEDVVDLFHPVAMKKDVDVVLDLFDGSILKHSIVKGDQGKLKQILSNLLSNAVKFTPEGHITVRSWAQELTLEDPSQSSNQKVQRDWLSRLFFWKKEESKDTMVTSTIQRNPNSMEFVFEVDDTGKGIPEEKRKSVFENYVQVKETAQGQGGTGLGLAIVQSLVRLMGGDIKIMDKEKGERGTCFRFNIVLAVSGEIQVFPKNLLSEDDTMNKELSPRVQDPSLQLPGSLRNASSSLAILFIGTEERRRVTRTFMERLGIKVCVGKEWSDLASILSGVQQKLGISLETMSRKSDMSQKTESLVKSALKNPSSGLDQIQAISSLFLLPVIDTSFGPIMELIRLLSEFRGGLQNSSAAAGCKVVWLGKPSVCYRRVLEEEGNLNLSGDVIISRPFHGTHLIKAIKLLPEFGGASMVKNESGKLEEIASSGETVVAEIREEVLDEVKPLTGKRVLLVEDSAVLSRFAKSVLLALGAITDVCKNGEEAFMTVSSRLSEQMNLASGASSSSGSPYSFILMDCEMPIVDGYEATRRIREEEKKYNARIPIIALTAHSEGTELKMIVEAGMDSYIDKPLKKERLIEVLEEMQIT